MSSVVSSSLYAAPLDPQVLVEKPFYVQNWESIQKTWEFVLMTTSPIYRWMGTQIAKMNGKWMIFQRFFGPIFVWLAHQAEHKWTFVRTAMSPICAWIEAQVVKIGKKAAPFFVSLDSILSLCVHYLRDWISPYTVFIFKCLSFMMFLLFRCLNWLLVTSYAQYLDWRMTQRKGWIVSNESYIVEFHEMDVNNLEKKAHDHQACVELAAKHKKSIDITFHNDNKWECNVVLKWEGKEVPQTYRVNSSGSTCVCTFFPFPFDSKNNNPQVLELTFVPLRHLKILDDLEEEKDKEVRLPDKESTRYQAAVKMEIDPLHSQTKLSVTFVPYKC